MGGRRPAGRKVSPAQWVDAWTFATTHEAERYAALRDRCRREGVLLVYLGASKDRAVFEWGSGRRQREAFALHVGKANKYRAKRTTIGDQTFASKREASRFLVLKRLEESGAIARLECQPEYLLEIAGRKIAKYVADFRYVTTARPVRVVIEDAKGYKTPVYRLKKKLVEALYGIEVVEV